MKKVKFIIALTAIMLIAGGCATNVKQRAEKKERLSTTVKHHNVGYFSKIVADGMYNIIFRQGENADVKVVGPEKLIRDISVNVKGNTCYIFETKHKMGNRNIKNYSVFKREKKRIRDYSSKVKIIITSPDLTDLSLIGMGNFTCQTHLDTDTLHITNEGAGSVSFADVICDDLDVDIEGMGDFKLGNARCAKASLLLSGLGSIKANLSNVAQTSVAVEGLGSAKVQFNDCDSCTSTLDGLGSIVLSGDLKHLEKETDGLGKISTKGLKKE